MTELECSEVGFYEIRISESVLVTDVRCPSQSETDSPWLCCCSECYSERESCNQNDSFHVCFLFLDK